MATGSSSAAPDSPPTPVSARRLPAPSFESLRDREFRLYWLGTALVFFDQGMANVALAWLMLELTESAAWVSIAVAVRGLPTVLLTVPAGILADRWDRRRLLILSQSVAALGAVAFAALVWRGQATPALALAYALLLGSSTAVGIPTRQAVIPMLEPPALLLNAVVTGAMARTSSQPVGPALAGLLIAWCGPEASFAAQAIFLVLSTVALIPLRSASPAAPGDPGVARAPLARRQRPAHSETSARPGASSVPTRPCS